MKSMIGLILPMLMLCTACDNRAQKETGPTQTVVAGPHLAAIVWEEQAFDFGEVALMENSSHRFLFQNVGSVPLVIEDAKTGGGPWRVSAWQDSTLPGQHGYVEGELRLSTPGIFKKSIVVTTNTEPKHHVLRVQGIGVE